MKWYWWLLIGAVAVVSGWWLWSSYSTNAKMEAVRKAKAAKNSSDEENTNTPSV